MISHACYCINLFKASQPRGRASGSHAYGRHEMQGVILKCTRHEFSVFVNLRPHLLRIRNRHQFSSPEKKKQLPLRDSNPRSSIYQTENTNSLLQHVFVVIYSHRYVVE